MGEKFTREIYYYKHYFIDFYKKQTNDVKKKIDWTLTLITEIERIPVKFFKHMEGSDGLYEIRIEVGSNIFRVFSFFDEGRLIILLNGFLKKSEKTPKNEIEIASKLKREYFEEKDK